MAHARPAASAEPECGPEAGDGKSPVIHARVTCQLARCARRHAGRETDAERSGEKLGPGQRDREPPGGTETEKRREPRCQNRQWSRPGRDRSN